MKKHVIPEEERWGEGGRERENKRKRREEGCLSNRAPRGTCV